MASSLDDLMAEAVELGLPNVSLYLLLPEQKREASLRKDIYREKERLKEEEKS